MPSTNNILKRLEIAIRRKIIKFLSNNSNSNHNSKKDSDRIHIEKSGNYFSLNENCKILLLRQDRIGDVLISTPFIRILRGRFPAAQIDILLGNKNFGARHCVEKYVNNCWLYNRKIFPSLLLIKRLRNQRYDLIIDLFDNASATSSLFIKLIKSNYKLGISKENEYVYSHTVAKPDKNKYHIVERTAALLNAFGIDPSQQSLSLEYEFSQLEISIAKAKMKSGCLLIGFNLAGSSRRKFWGVDNNIALINKIAEYIPKAEIKIFSTEDYRDELNHICSNSNSIPSPKVSSFHEYAALLSQCGIIISPDTAAVHIAAAAGIPCVAIFEVAGSAKTGKPWGPYGSPGEVVTTKSPDLSGLSPEDVFAAFIRIYESHFLTESEGCEEVER